MHVSVFASDPDSDLLSTAVMSYEQIDVEITVTGKTNHSKSDARHIAMYGTSVSSEDSPLPRSRSCTTVGTDGVILH
jgi:hypothetical protein